MQKVTLEQAEAFLDALVGWEDAGETQRPKSPHAFTHLSAILGLGKLPGPDVFGRLAFLKRWIGKGLDNEYHIKERDDLVPRVLPLIEYLEGVTAALRSVLPDEERNEEA